MRSGQYWGRDIRFVAAASDVIVGGNGRSKAGWVTYYCYIGRSPHWDTSILGPGLFFPWRAVVTPYNFCSILVRSPHLNRRVCDLYFAVSNQKHSVVDPFGFLRHFRFNRVPSEVSLCSLYASASHVIKKQRCKSLVVYPQPQASPFTHLDWSYIRCKANRKSSDPCSGDPLHATSEAGGKASVMGVS